MDEYQEVANIVGAEMGKSWENIISKLVQASGPQALNFAGGPLNTSDIGAFVAKLGAAHLDVTFSTLEASAKTAKAKVVQIVLGDDVRASASNGKVGAAAVSGSISIGINIGF
ncbi:hypothetical protein [Pseudomonas donghuensis]|uniref:hypothetical protein n=1 Tax=Pseudomonas donghuensis TaxID=1163398 RepID=UPI0020C21663|nr:hypothetical protein [Pseudomonas donghuensis]MCP6696355.1 hypothetical protein [Pseudomonas donghuensis]